MSKSQINPYVSMGLAIFRFHYFGMTLHSNGNYTHIYIYFDYKTMKLLRQAYITSLGGK